MGAWNQPAILPRQPTFLEQIMPTALGFLSNLALAKVGQNWKAKEAKIAADRATATQMLKAEIAGQVRTPKRGKGETTAAESQMGQVAPAARISPTATWETPPKGRAFQAGGKTYEVVPMEERIQTIDTPYGKVMVGPSDMKMLHVKQQSSPKTAMAAFLRDNPNATPDEMAAYAQKLKGKFGAKILPDGTIEFQYGGGGDLTPATTGAVQKEVVGLMDQLQEMEELGKMTFRDALTVQGKLKGAGLRLADWMNIDIGPGGKEFLGRTRQFIEGIEQVFNRYRKEITGAQAAMKEISMLRQSILNKKLTPTEFEYSFNRYVGQIKRTLRLKRMLLREGVSGKELGKRIDQMFLSGKDVPSTEIDARGDELSKTGLSNEQVVVQLRKEGYFD